MYLWVPSLALESMETHLLVAVCTSLSSVSEGSSPSADCFLNSYAKFSELCGSCRWQSWLCPLQFMAHGHLHPPARKSHFSFPSSSSSCLWVGKVRAALQRETNWLVLMAWCGTFHAAVGGCSLGRCSVLYGFPPPFSALKKGMRVVVICTLAEQCDPVLTGLGRILGQNYWSNVLQFLHQSCLLPPYSITFGSKVIVLINLPNPH